MTDATPAAHIQALQRARPKRPLDIRSVRDKLSGRDIASDSELAKAVQAINASDYAERLLDGIRARFPPNVAAAIDSGRIAVGEVDEDTVGAYSARLETGHAVILHRATHEFIYRIARILSTRFVPDEKADSSELPFEETARIMAEAFWWYQETGRAFGPTYPVSTDQLKIAFHITYETIAFLLCHEIAHAIVDQEASSTGPVEPEDSPHLDEHGADVLGAMLALGLGSDAGLRPTDALVLSYAGIEFALQIYAVLERVGIPFSDSHPGAAERLMVIRLMLIERFSERSWEILTRLARGIEQVFEEIARLIADPAEHEAFFERQAASVVAELDSLLEVCATVPVPDYARFYDAAGKIVQQGYSQTLLDRIAQVTAEFYQSVEEGSEADFRTRFIRFQKFKLLFGWIDQWLNEPARTLFRSALEPLRER